MPNAARIALETVLRSRKLDRTLTTALPLAERGGADVAVAPTGIPALDRSLQGGLPRGQLSDIAGPASSGRTTLMLQILAAATRRGEMAALVDTFDCLDVPSAVVAGVDLDRLLWIRAQGPGSGSHGTSLDRTVDRAIKALSLVLQAGNVGLVALDLADAPPTALNRLPFTTWLRVQRMIEGRETTCVLVAPQPLARSAGGVTLSLAGRARWAGDSARSRRVAGLDVTIRIVAARRRQETEVTVRADAVGQDDQGTAQVERRTCHEADVAGTAQAEGCALHETVCHAGALAPA